MLGKATAVRFGIRGLGHLPASDIHPKRLVLEDAILTERNGK